MILERHPVFGKYAHTREYDVEKACILVKIVGEISTSDLERLMGMGWLFDTPTNTWIKYSDLRGVSN